MAWHVIGLFGTGATVGGFVGGYLFARASAPAGCTLTAFEEGVFSYLCRGAHGLYVEAIGLEVTGIAVLAGAAAGFLAVRLFD